MTILWIIDPTYHSITISKESAPFLNTTYVSVVYTVVLQFGDLTPSVVCLRIADRSYKLCNLSFLNEI